VGHRTYSIEVLNKTFQLPGLLSAPFLLLWDWSGPLPSCSEFLVVEYLLTSCRWIDRCPLVVVQGPVSVLLVLEVLYSARPPCRGFVMMTG